MNSHSKVFIADDEPEVVALLRDILTRQGYEVAFTHNSKEIIPKVKSFLPDVILLDLLMPGNGGFEICDMLNEQNDIQSIPIIVISGLNDFPDIKQAYKKGVVGYLTKPVAFDVLLREVAKAIVDRK